ncbi:MAG: hypothetical protein WAZ19_02670 [Anaerolineae bacterium]
MPELGDPQSLNRYSYVLNNPLKYTDPTGHSACMPLAPVAPAFAVCQLGERILQYGPQIINLIQQLTISAPQATALVDQFAQAAQASGNGSASSNAGNTAGPGGLDPNDPIFQQIIQQTGESDLIKAIARASIEGPAKEGARNGVTVLGRYPTYIQTATKLRANYLNFAEGTWDKLTDVQRWAVNKQFLDDAIARGDIFKLASLAEEAKPGTYFYRELEYLISLGYQVVDGILVKVN